LKRAHGEEVLASISPAPSPGVPVARKRAAGSQLSRENDELQRVQSQFSELQHGLKEHLRSLPDEAHRKEFRGEYCCHNAVAC